MATLVSVTWESLGHVFLIKLIETWYAELQRLEKLWGHQYWVIIMAKMPIIATTGVTCSRDIFLMMTWWYYWLFVEGTHWLAMDFKHKGPVNRALMVSLLVVFKQTFECAAKQNNSPNGTSPYSQQTVCHNLTFGCSRHFRRLSNVFVPTTRFLTCGCSVYEFHRVWN